MRNCTAVPARQGHLVLVQTDLAQGAAARQFDLHADEVDAGHFLGYGVLDLEPRIGLDEGEGRGVARRIRIDQEFERSEAPEVHVVGQPHGGIAKLLAQAGVEAGTGRDLHDLLVAALQRAIALPDMAGGLAVARDLDLDVAGARHERFGIDLVVAERSLGFRAAARVGGFQFVFLGHDAHAAAAPAGDRLDDDGAACLEERTRLFQRRRALRARQHGNAEAFGQRAGAGLVAEDRQHLRRRPDEVQPRRLAGGRKVGILRQEAITRMHRIAAGGLGRGNDPRDVEIGRRPAAAERLRGVGRPHMGGGGVVIGVDGDAA